MRGSGPSIDLVGDGDLDRCVANFHGNDFPQHHGGWPTSRSRAWSRRRSPRKRVALPTIARELMSKNGPGIVALTAQRPSLCKAARMSLRVRTHATYKRRP